MFFGRIYGPLALYWFHVRLAPATKPEDLESVYTVSWLRSELSVWDDEDADEVQDVQKQSQFWW